MSLQRIN